MGYRSDVRLITSKKGFEELQKFVKNYLGKDNKDDNLLENPDIRFVHSNGVLLGWNDIKWYEYCDHKDVDSIEAGLEHLKDNDFSYRFARIGEDYNDYDYNYCESSKDREKYLPCPCMERYFNDEEIKKQLSQLYESNNEKEVVM